MTDRRQNEQMSLMRQCAPQPAFSATCSPVQARRNQVQGVGGGSLVHQRLPHIRPGDGEGAVAKVWAAVGGMKQGHEPWLLGWKVGSTKHAPRSIVLCQTSSTEPLHHQEQEAKHDEESKKERKVNMGRGRGGGQAGRQTAASEGRDGGKRGAGGQEAGRSRQPGNQRHRQARQRAGRRAGERHTNPSCFCGLVSGPCLDHEAESGPANVRFCWRYEPFSVPPPP